MAKGEASRGYVATHTICVWLRYPPARAALPRGHDGGACLIEALVSVALAQLLGCVWMEFPAISASRGRGSRGSDGDSYRRVRIALGYVAGAADLSGDTATDALVIEEAVTTALVDVLGRVVVDDIRIAPITAAD